VSARVPAFVVAIALLLPGEHAAAGPACRGVAPLSPNHPPSQFAAAPVGAAVVDKTLSLWPLGTEKLNPGAGVEVAFAGGRTCFSTFTRAGEDGIRLDADGPVAAVQLALCDSGGGFCIPVRVELKR
jgi:hypothetical protein